MPHFWVKFVIFWAVLGSCLVQADAVVDPDSYDQKARDEYIKRFTEFTKDKNVMGTANKPTGDIVQSKDKRVFNKDDRNNFQNDLTYHKNSYEMDETFKDPTAPGGNGARVLPAWVSAHGKMGNGTGSSVLERGVYKWHEKYSKDANNPSRRRPPPKKGVKEEDIYKITTNEVVEKDPNNPSGPNNILEVKRTELREEVKEEVEKIGSNSYNSIARAAKDPERKNDPKALPSLSFLYESARRGLEAMWNNAAASLAQKRANKLLVEDTGGRLSGAPKAGLNNDTPKCEDWARTADANAKKQYKNNPSALKNALKDIAEMTAECKKMISTDYKSINPEYEDKMVNGKPTRNFKPNGDPKKEDDKERELRIQMNVLAKAGIRLNEIPSFWKYKDKDERAKVVTSYDDQGNPQEAQMLRVDEQIEMYNQELEEAAKDYTEVKKRMPELDIKEEDILKNKIKLKSKRIDQITRVNKAMAEDLGLGSSIGQKQLTDKYEDIYTSQPKIAGESGEGSSYVDFKVDPKPAKALGGDVLVIDEGKK